MRTLGGLLGAAVVGLILSQAAIARAQCGAEVCPPEPPPPPACTEVNQNFTDVGCPADFATNDMDFCFADNVPSGSGFPTADTGDGQIYVLGNNANGAKDCGIIQVKETGYYAIFDSELSESCADQKDETGYLTIQNSCNGDGWATTRNVDNRFLVLDRDNGGAGCVADSECQTDYVCREGNSHGRCCVPKDPVFVGTFLLVAGEENVICINHWCPEWETLRQSDPATYEKLFVQDPDNPQNNCTSADSIHFKIAASAIACKQEGFLQACAGGCAAGDCKPHPCVDADCPSGFCTADAAGNAACSNTNPCATAQCEHGCVYGLCLQGPDAVGEDGDGDGFPDVADCDDTKNSVHPGASEDCSNGIDDNCDGIVDCAGSGDGGLFEQDGGLGSGGSASGAGGSGASAGSNGLSSGSSSDDGGCGCSTPGGSSRGALALVGLFGLGLIGARRRRDR